MIENGAGVYSKDRFGRQCYWLQTDTCLRRRGGLWRIGPPIALYCLLICLHLGYSLPAALDTQEHPNLFSIVGVYGRGITSFRITFLWLFLALRETNIVSPRPPMFPAGASLAPETRGHFWVSFSDRQDQLLRPGIFSLLFSPLLTITDLIWVPEK